MVEALNHSWQRGGVEESKGPFNKTGSLQPQCARYFHTHHHVISKPNDFENVRLEKGERVEMAFGKRPAKNQVRRSTKNPAPQAPKAPPIPAQANCTQPLESQAQLSTSLASRPLPIPFRPHIGHSAVSNTRTQNVPRPVAYSLPSSGLEQSTSLIQRREASGAVLESWQERTTDHSNQDPILRDLIASKFDTVITSIDSESFSGDEEELGAESILLTHNALR